MITGVGVKILMEAVSSDEDIGRRRLTDLEGVRLGSIAAVVNAMMVSEILTGVIDGRDEEIGKLGIGEASEVVRRGEMDGRDEEIGKLGIGEASEVVGSTDGIIGVVKGISGGIDVGMSTGVEKKKLGWIDIEVVVGNSMLDLTVKGTERDGVGVMLISIAVAVSSISSTIEVETAAMVVVSGAGLWVSSGLEASEEGTTLVGGTVITGEVSTAVKMGVD